MVLMDDNRRRPRRRLKPRKTTEKMRVADGEYVEQFLRAVEREYEKTQKKLARRLAAERVE